MMESSIETGSVEETMALGERLGNKISPGSVIALIGEMGSGKTYLTKGIAKSLGIDPDHVVSPTFTLLNLYEGKIMLCHLDLYRLSSAQDVFDLGIEDYLDDAVVAIEWANRIPDALPPDHIEVTLTHQGAEKRKIQIRGTGNRSKDFMAQL